MNGYKRASRRQAAIVGLAVLMGASFLGCHSGPRLFAKRDQDARVSKKELAEKETIERDEYESIIVAQGIALKKKDDEILTK